MKKRIKDLFEISAGGDISSIDFSSDKTSTHIYPVYSNALTDRGLYGFSNTFKISKMALTITARGNIGFSFVRDVNFTPIGRLLTLTLKKKNINIKYINYILQKNNINYNTTAIPQLTSTDIGSHIIDIKHSFDKQNKIVSFLDEKCSKIDNEVSLLNQKSILLDEYKNALIYETVTKGLDKNAEMKDSGVEWIGDIPKNWKIKRLKNCVTYLKLTKADLDSPDYLEIGDVDIKNNDYNLSNKEKLSVDTAKMSPKDVLLISTVRPNRKVITITKYEHPVSNAFCTLKCNKYWFYLVKTDGFSNELVKLNKSSIYPTCKDVDILNQQICIPSELEQVQIYLFLDLETKKIEKQIELINKKVELLKEYKQSLIYEAVTGQLEIE